MQRPDLTHASPDVVAYIEYLEKKAGARNITASPTREKADDFPDRASEALPPDHNVSAQILTFTRAGFSKKTFRNLYSRQHRGGMGVFGIDIDAPDFPLALAAVEGSQNLLIFTNQARVFRLAAAVVQDTPVFAKGASILDRLPLNSDETIVAALPEQARGYVAFIGEGGRVRCLRHHLFGEHMKPGWSVFNPREFGALASACWTPGDAELFIVTAQGMGIRFAEKSISPQGDQGIRLSNGDKAVGIASVYPDSNVLMASADGRGVLRTMSGFAANKSPGGSGKIAIKSGSVVSVATLEINDDVLMISRQGKVIRFPASELPVTEGVAQGVICMSLRADEVVAMIKHGPVY